MAASYYQIPPISTYAGGTEATAFNPRSVAALQRSGFSIESLSTDANPKYEVFYSQKALALIAFSKKFDDVANPTQDFASVMTCSEADADCPLVPGAKYRIALPFQDPKEADGTATEAEVYDERNRQIATEMLYSFSQVVV